MSNIIVNQLSYEGVIKNNIQWSMPVEYIIDKKHINHPINNTFKGGDEIINDAISFDDLDLTANVQMDELIGNNEYIKKTDVSSAVSSKKINKSDITVYYNDNVLEFREKLQLLTGIPLYKQHVYYIYQGKTYPMSYKVSTTVTLGIDARDIKDEGDSIMSVPVDPSIMNKIDLFEVVSYEEFRIMSDIIKRTNNIYILSIDEVFKDKAQLNINIGDIYTKNLLYYSFVIKYWPMMTIDIFTQYVKNEIDINIKYPKLSPKDSIIKTKIDKQLSVIKDIRSVNTNVDYIIGITHATLYNKGHHQVNLRNLFDMFQLSDDIKYMRCKCMINGKMYELSKNYKNAHILREKLNINSILLNVQIKMPNGLYSNASMHISLNGTYIIKTEWRDDFYITWDNLYKIVSTNINPIINKINAMGQHVINRMLPIVTSNTKIININMSIYWKSSIGNVNFNTLLKGVEKYISCGFISPKQTIGNVNEFIFVKGMYKFNHLLIEDLVRGITNYYSRYYDGNTRQKWEGLFEKNRIYKINHRHSDVKFDISNIKQEETDIFIQLTLKLIQMVSKNMYPDNQLLMIDKKLRKLKEIDPELYDFKKAHQSSEVLSKKCQKPLQPIIYTPTEWNKYKKYLSSKDLERVLKYHNFTTGEPAYYECSDKKYPYPRFITGVHPSGYCLPCCKKTPPNNDDNNKKTIIHKQCVENHTFDDANVDESNSRYVSYYGKDIESGRLTYLPDEILGHLFYDYGIEDEECRLDTEYYILGVNQLYNNIQIGILYCASIVLEKSTSDIINDIKLYIKSNPIIIKSYFDDVNEFDILLKSTNSNISNVSNSKYIDLLDKWNDIFIELLPIVYSNWRFIIISIDGNNAFINIPNILKKTHHYINNDTDVALIISKNSDRDSKIKQYYPIIYANKDIYYKNNTIDKVSYTSEYKIITSIIDMIGFKLIKNDITKLSLDKIIEFSNVTGKTITSYYVNNMNECYAVIIDNIYIPIHYSFYDGSNIVSYPYKRSNAVSIDKLMDFVNIYNKRTDNKIIPYRWVYIQKINDIKKLYIGFEYQQLVFYCNMKPSDCAKYTIQSTNELRFYYDSDVINNEIKHIGKMDTNLYNTTQRSLYNKNIYKMIILEYINLFNSERNNTIRNSIKKYIIKTNMSKKYNPADIDKLVPYEDDRLSIKILISEYMYEHRDKELLLSLLELLDYKFDKTTKNILQSIDDHDELVKKLHVLGKQLFVEKDINNNIEFDNIYISCSEKSNKHNTVCDKNKLIISKGLLSPLLDILASDIKNSLKRETLFSRIVNKIEIDPFKFRKYPYEELSYHQII